ncbi:MAG: hypothetical protein J0M05_04855, partial [Candidatus Kapabacteria bacterium]|nr:hypothetical protein [Candidatus Kapabacteria bacterium]
MKKHLHTVLGLFALALLPQLTAYAQTLTPYTFGTMRAREIGPATSSGRITAIEAAMALSAFHWISLPIDAPTWLLPVLVTPAFGKVFC